MSRKARLSPSQKALQQLKPTRLPEFYLEGKEAHKSVQIAVSEINAKGGVNVGGTKRMLKVAAADLRDAAPGVPVPEALLGLEKIILELQN